MNKPPLIARHDPFARILARCPQRKTSERLSEKNLASSLKMSAGLSPMPKHGFDLNGHARRTKLQVRILSGAALPQFACRQLFLLELTGPIFRPRQARRQLGPGVSASHVELPLGQTRRIGKVDALDTGQKEKGAVKVYRRGERRSSEVRPCEIGKREAAAADIGVMELRTPQFCLCEINIGQIGVLEIRALHFRARKHSALRVHTAEVGPVGLDSVEPGAFGGRVGQGSTHKRCLLKICRKEIAVPEVGRSEINTEQVRPAQVLSF
jgi:hypothetical protein